MAALRCAPGRRADPLPRPDRPAPLTLQVALHGLWRRGPEERGLWNHGTLHLWAEDARLVADARPGPRHPFAVPAAGIRELLAGAGPGLEWAAAQGAERFTTLVLPTNGVPQPSPETGEEAAGPWQPHAWRVPVLELADAAPLLGELFDAGPWRGGFLTTVDGVEVDVAHGASLRWLVAVHDEAYRTVRAGHVVPQLTRGRAVWVPAPQDWTPWRVLADAAPGSVLAGSVLAGSVPAAAAAPGSVPAAAAGLLTDELMSAFVDAEARAALAGRAPLLGVGRGRRPAPGSAVEAWVEALTTGGPVDGDTALLEVQLTAWARTSAAPPGRVRTCFRLVEPSGPDLVGTPEQVSEDWTLELLLQLVDTPSVLVRAADVWAGGSALRALERVTDDPVGQFLADLSRAAAIAPLLRRASGAARPAELVLTRAEAVVLLRDEAGPLAEAGFGVLLPTWWTGPTRVGLSLGSSLTGPRSADVPSASSGIVATPARLDRKAVLDVRWGAVLGSAKLSHDELVDLAEATVPLVRVRGRWTLVDPQQIRAALLFLQRPKPLAVGEVGRVAVSGRVDDLDVLVVDGVLPEPAVAALAPAGDPGVLRPYQQAGVAWLEHLARLGLGGVLADDMGLGKTVQVLALLARSAGPTLVVCPLSMVGTWRREAARFAPDLRVSVHHGSDRSLDPAADVVVTTYGLLVKDAALLQAAAWDRVVLDEAQTVKNPATLMARALRGLVAGQLVALTGTPVENRLADLHTLLDLTNPGLFGTLGDFTARFSVPVERDGDAAVAADLARRIRPVVLRRLKSDPAVAADLPARDEMTVWCTLTAEQAGLYKAVVDDMMTKIRGARGVGRRGAVLAALTRLRQVCNHPAHLLKDGSRLAGRSGKLVRLEGVLDSSAALGDRTLLFTQFTAFGGRLAEHLTERSGADVPFLHGSLTARARDGLVADFQRDGGPAVMVLSLKAGGTGLTLTAANQVVHVDRWWNPAVEDQASDRVHRIGQTRDVQIRKLVCIGTLEERIDAMLTAKRDLADRVLSSGHDGGRFTEVGDDELEELLTLDPGAVEGE